MLNLGQKWFGWSSNKNACLFHERNKYKYSCWLVGMKRRSFCCSSIEQKNKARPLRSVRRLKPTYYKINSCLLTLFIWILLCYKMEMQHVKNKVNVRSVEERIICVFATEKIIVIFIELHFPAETRKQRTTKTGRMSALLGLKSVRHYTM